MNKTMGVIAISAFMFTIFGLIAHIISCCGKMSNERADKILLVCLFAALALLGVGLCAITISMALNG